MVDGAWRVAERHTNVPPGSQMNYDLMVDAGQVWFVFACLEEQVRTFDGKVEEAFYDAW